MFRVLYPCDPDLHTECSKENCFKTGGPCTHTDKLVYAAKPVGKVKMIVDAEDFIEEVETDE